MKTARVCSTLFAGLLPRDCWLVTGVLGGYVATLQRRERACACGGTGWKVGTLALRRTLTPFKVHKVADTRRYYLNDKNSSV